MSACKTCLKFYYRAKPRGLPFTLLVTVAVALLAFAFF